MFLKMLQISQKSIFSGGLFLIKLQAGKGKLSEVATGDVLLKKVFLKRHTGVSEPAVHTSSTQKRCFRLFLITFQFSGREIVREIFKLLF